MIQDLFSPIETNWYESGSYITRPEGRH
jgi:hypothetical protein